MSRRRTNQTNACAPGSRDALERLDAAARAAGTTHAGLVRLALAHALERQARQVDRRRP